jgi:hypothetical protein
MWAALRTRELRFTIPQRWGSELDRGGHPGVHTTQRGVPAHAGYAATRARRAALCRGLDGVLLAVSAQPAGQPARGFVVTWHGHPSWSSDG